MAKKERLLNLCSLIKCQSKACDKCRFGVDVRSDKSCSKKSKRAGRDFQLEIVVRNLQMVHIVSKKSY